VEAVMDLPNGSIRVFNIISRFGGGIFLCMALLCPSSIYVYADDDSKVLTQSGAVTIEAKTSQSLKSENLENTAISREAINLRRTGNRISSSHIQDSSISSSKSVSHSGISLRSNVSAASGSSQNKPVSHWVRGKISKSTPSLAITTSQSKELQKLRKNREDSKAAFKNSLETNSAVRNSLLLKQPVDGAKGSEKYNE
jgi:hypothetical protein